MIPAGCRRKGGCGDDGVRSRVACHRRYPACRSRRSRTRGRSRRFRMRWVPAWVAYAAQSVVRARRFHVRAALRPRALSRCLSLKARRAPARGDIVAVGRARGPPLVPLLVPFPALIANDLGAGNRVVDYCRCCCCIDLAAACRRRHLAKRGEVRMLRHVIALG